MSTIKVSNLKGDQELGKSQVRAADPADYMPSRALSPCFKRVYRPLRGHAVCKQAPRGTAPLAWHKSCQKEKGLAFGSVYATMPLEGDGAFGTPFARLRWGSSRWHGFCSSPRGQAVPLARRLLGSGVGCLWHALCIPLTPRQSMVGWHGRCI